MLFVFGLIVGVYYNLDGTFFNDSFIASVLKNSSSEDIKYHLIVEYILKEFFSYTLIACLILFSISSVGYSFGTLHFQKLQRKARTQKKTQRIATNRYRNRTRFQIAFGYLFKLTLIAINFLDHSLWQTPLK